VTRFLIGRSESLCNLEWPHECTNQTIEKLATPPIKGLWPQRKIKQLRYEAFNSTSHTRSCWIALRQQQLNPKHYASRPTEMLGWGAAENQGGSNLDSDWRTFLRQWSIVKDCFNIDVNGRWHQLRERKRGGGPARIIFHPMQNPPREPLFKFA
jgi:hypothetical protein